MGFTVTFSSFYLFDWIFVKIADKPFKKNKTKEATDPNKNDLEINDDSAKDNLIINNEN